jgi:hypothetical protein
VGDVAVLMTGWSVLSGMGGEDVAAAPDVGTVEAGEVEGEGDLNCIPASLPFAELEVDDGHAAVVIAAGAASPPLAVVPECRIRGDAGVGSGAAGWDAGTCICIHWWELGWDVAMCSPVGAESYCYAEGCSN